jgi:hypothetical protein
MRKISYESEEGIFNFHQEDVIETLQSFDTDETRELIDFLESQPGDKVIIPRDNRLFPYAVLKLLDRGKGNVFCKACRKQYEPGNLQPFTLAAGESPFKVGVQRREGLLKRILGKPKRLPLFGGKGYRCPEGHDLIGVVTWRT